MPPANLAETARALNLMNETYLTDTFGREPRVARGGGADAHGDLGRGHPPLTKGLAEWTSSAHPTSASRICRVSDEPNYVEVDGLRLHHVDEGSGPTVLCFHGEPSWSYLYRHMLDRLVGEDRVVCPLDGWALRQADRPGLVHVRPPRREVTATSSRSSSTT